MVYIPMTTMQRLLQGKDGIGSMVLSTGDRDLAGSTAMVDAIDGDLRLRHAVHPEDQRAVRVRDNQEEYAMFDRIFKGLRLFIWVIGGFTLLAGAIGVANIMAIVVKERTVEIGVRKALGATSGSILSLIVIEAICLGEHCVLAAHAKCPRPDRGCSDAELCGALCPARLLHQSRSQPAGDGDGPDCPGVGRRLEWVGSRVAGGPHPSH